MNDEKLIEYIFENKDKSFLCAVCWSAVSSFVIGVFIKYYEKRHN